MLKLLKQGDKKNIILLVPGYTSGFQAEIFVDFLTKVPEGYCVYGVVIDYQHTDDFTISMQEIENALAELRAEYKDAELTMVAKSLGAALCLGISLSDYQVNKLVILGLPMVLGWPPRMSMLLEGKKFSFSILDEYKPLFLKNRHTHLVLIAGSNDDLFDVNVFNKMKMEDRVVLLYLQGVDHSMKCGGDTSLVIQSIVSILS